MIRLRDIFKGRAQGQEEILPVDVVAVPDPADDEALFLLMEELGDLGEVRVPAAARQRGWAQVRAEVRTRQARGAFSPVGVKLRGMAHSRRLAIGSTAALVAIALGVVAVLQLGEPGPGPGVVDTSVTTATTALADNPSTTQEPSSTTGGTSTTTKPAQPSTTAPASTSTSGSSVTTGGGATLTTAPPPVTTTEPGTSTTQPASTTTSQQLMTAEERERSAKAASALLAAAVISGDPNNTVAVLSSSAGRGLAQMVSVLQDPQTYGILSVEDVDQRHARVLVQFIDRTRDAQGRIVDAAVRFLFELKVDVNGATIIGIYAAPAQ